jgi:ketosteroid isomerase-like protein
MHAPLEALHEYYKAFSTLDLSAILSHFSEPSMTIAPQGLVAAANHAALAESLAPLIEGLRAKGYGRSEFVDAEVTTLGETAALVRGKAVRYAAAGSEMERIPIGYVMHRHEDGWKIAVLVVGG